MYVYEEIFEGKKLSEVINSEHENKKYLPGVKLPENVVSVKIAKDGNQATKLNSILVLLVLCITFV